MWCIISISPNQIIYTILVNIALVQLFTCWQFTINEILIIIMDRKVNTATPTWWICSHCRSVSCCYCWHLVKNSLLLYFLLSIFIIYNIYIYIYIIYIQIVVFSLGFTFRVFAFNLFFVLWKVNKFTEIVIEHKYQVNINVYSHCIYNLYNIINYFLL